MERHKLEYNLSNNLTHIDIGRPRHHDWVADVTVFGDHAEMEVAVGGCVKGTLGVDRALVADIEVVVGQLRAVGDLGVDSLIRVLSLVIKQRQR